MRRYQNSGFAAIAAILFVSLFLTSCRAPMPPAESMGTAAISPSPTLSQQTQLPGSLSPQVSASAPVLPAGAGNSIANIANGGAAATSQGWIYYRGGKGYIYKMKADGSSKTQLNSDDSWYINAVGDTVYYENKSDGGFLYAMNVDGSGRRALNKTESEYVFYLDGWLYYLKKDPKRVIEKMRADGTEASEIPLPPAEEVQSFAVQGDTIYYYSIEKDTDKDGEQVQQVAIKSMNAGGGEPKILDSTVYVNGRGDWFGALQPVGNYLYYTFGGGTDNYIYSLNTDTGDKKRLSSPKDLTCFRFNAQDGFLYCIYSDYMDAASDFDCAVIRTDMGGGKGVSLLKSKNADDFDNICVAGDWLFYTKAGSEAAMLNIKSALVTPKPTQAPKPACAKVSVDFNYETMKIVVKGLDKKGKVMWTRKWTVKDNELGQIDPCSPAALSGGLAYLRVKDDMLALNAATGKTLWSSPTASDIVCAPIVRDGTVYVCTYFSGQLVGFSSKNGKKLFASDAGDNYYWAYKLEFKGKNILVYYEVAGREDHKGKAVFDAKGKLISRS